MLVSCGRRLVACISPFWMCVKTKLITCKYASTTGRTGIQNLFSLKKSVRISEDVIFSLCCIEVFLLKSFIRHLFST